MLVGISDSPIARSLIEKSALTVDYLEVHGPNLASARQRLPAFPFLLHNSFYNWSLTHPHALEDNESLSVTLERLERSKAPWFSLHLGFSAADVVFKDQTMAAISETLSPETIFERCCQVIHTLKAHLAVPLLLENLDYNPTGAYETICEPDFINAVITATNCEILLDIAHARVSASALGYDLDAYLAHLPLDRIRQIHVNRPTSVSNRLFDSHAALEEPDFDLITTLVHQYHPWAVTLEYNQDASKICEQIFHLRTICKGSS